MNGWSALNMRGSEMIMLKAIMIMPRRKSGTNGGVVCTLQGGKFWTCSVFGKMSRIAFLCCAIESRNFANRFYCNDDDDRFEKIFQFKNINWLDLHLFVYIKINKQFCYWTKTIKNQRSFDWHDSTKRRKMSKESILLITFLPIVACIDWA